MIFFASRKVFQFRKEKKLLLPTSKYSSVPNKRTCPNKRTWWNFDKNQISVQGGILIKILECRVKTGNFIHNKRES